MSYRNDFKQEIFDKVSKHLLKQNKKALNRLVGGCAYRSRSGKLKCAAGCLIPDSEYHVSMEGQIARNLEFFDDFGYSLLEISLVDELQVIHDKSSPSRWKEKLQQCAKDHGLVVNF